MQPLGSTPQISNDVFLKVINHFYSATSVMELSLRDSNLVKYKSTFVYHLPHIGAHDRDQRGRYWSSGISDEVIRYLDSRKNVNEPVRNYVMERGCPFWLSQLKDKQHQMSLDTLKRIDMALIHLGDGILAPLFGPFHKRAYAYISFGKPAAFYDEVFIWQIHSLLQARHTTYCIVQESFRSKIKLTPRESDVLELISFGKTNPEIGKILDISKNTVTGYVKQIFLKLNVSDRVSAALRASSYHIGK